MSKITKIIIGIVIAIVLAIGGYFGLIKEKPVEEQIIPPVTRFGGLQTVAVGNVTLGTENQTTFSHNNDGTVLIVAVGTVDSADTTVTAITYGGDSMTKAGGWSQSTNVSTSIWYITSPKTGANDVVITETAACHRAAAISFTGATDISGATGGSNVSTTQADGSITTDDVEDMVLFVVTVGVTTGIAPGGSQVEQFDGTMPSNGGEVEGSTLQASGGATAMSASWSGGTLNAYGGISIEAAASPEVPVKKRMW